MTFEEKLKCFVSKNQGGRLQGLNKEMDPTLVHVNNSELTFTLRFPVQEWQYNPRGELHGGMIAAMFDFAIGLGGVTVIEDGDIVTSDLNVSFLRRVAGDDCVLGTVFIQKIGQTIIRIRAEAFSENTQKLVATAMGNAVPIKGNNK